MAQLYRLFDVLRTWFQRSQSRRRLHDLDATLRRDIGVSAEDVRAEARKPFWRR